MSKKVMSVLEEMTGGKSYRAHKYGLDNNERPSIDYTEDNIIWQETAETKRNRNYVPLWDESKKVLTSGTNILSFFLDGSRRVFKVDDMGFVLPGGAKCYISRDSRTDWNWVYKKGESRFKTGKVLSGVCAFYA